MALANDLGAPIGSVVLLASALSLPFALAQPVLGPVGDQFGKARVLKIALWLSAFSLALGALAPNYPSLFVARMLTGLAGAGIMPVGMAMIGDLYPRGRQVAIARFVASAIIGQILGAVFAGMVAEHIGWRGVMWICFVVVLGVAIAANALLPKESAAPRTGAPGVRAALATYKRIFRNPRAWACYGSVFVVGGLTFGFLPFVAPELDGRGGGGAREAGFIIAGLAAGSLTFSLFLPLMLRVASRPSLMVAGGLLAGAGFCAYSLGLHWSAQAGVFALVGLGFFMLHNSVQAEVAEIEPSARSSAFGMHAFSFFMGQSAGPLIWSGAIATLGATAALVTIGAVLAAMGVIAGMIFRRLPRIVSGAL